MYRLSKYPQSVTKFVQLGSKCIPCDNLERHNFRSGFVNSSPSFDCLNPRMLAGGVSITPNLVGVVSRRFASHSGSFQVHPEKLRQIMREKEGHNLCNYYDSDGYKKKAVDVVEEQNRVITEGTPKNLEETDVTYEHMLSCAQPRQKPKVVVIPTKKPEEAVTDAPAPLKARLRISGKKKKQEPAPDIGLPVKEPQIVYAHDSTTKKEGMSIKDHRRKYRKRTTILPLYLKKMQDTMALKEKLAKTQADSSDIAQKFRNLENVDYENQMLNARKPIYIVKSQYKGEPDNKPEENEGKDNVINVDYESGLLNIDRFKVRSNRCRHAGGSEQNRHWHQNHNTVKKADDLDRKKVD